MEREKRADPQMLRLRRALGLLRGVYQGTSEQPVLLSRCAVTGTYVAASPLDSDKTAALLLEYVRALTAPEHVESGKLRI